MRLEVYIGTCQGNACSCTIIDMWENDNNTHNFSKSYKWQISYIMVSESVELEDLGIIMRGDFTNAIKA